MNKQNRRIAIGIIGGGSLIVLLYFFVSSGNESIWPKGRVPPLGEAGRVEADSGHRLIMGTFARVVAVAADSSTAEKCIEAAFERLRSTENLMSVHRDDSQISKINRDAYKGPVRVSKPTFEVLQKALEISRLSDGAFDITIGALVDLWRSADEANSVPTDVELLGARSKVGYEKLILDVNKESIRFAVDGMKLDLGGIAKGYAIDKAVEAMQRAGAAGGMVDVGGDIRCFGAPPRGKKHWLIGLQDPNIDAGYSMLDTRKTKPSIENQGKLLLKLKLVNRAVATSGGYRRFALVESKKYSHIIDAKTGYSSEGLASVTIISQNATDADALATAVSVMGTEKGLALIETIPETEAILIPAGSSELIKSSGAEKFISH